MSNEKSGKMNALFVAIVIPLILFISALFYMYVLGDPANFQNNDPVHGHPIETNPGKLYGTIYKGGFIVPILISINLIVIVFAVERFITLARRIGGISDHAGNACLAAETAASTSAAVEYTTLPLTSPVAGS